MNIIQQARDWSNGSQVPPCKQIMEDIHPPHKPSAWSSFGEERQKYIEEFGFSLPCSEMLDIIKQYSPILELGAGSGFLSKLLTLEGVDVIATDAFTSTYNQRRNGDIYKYKFSGNQHIVEKLNASTAVRKYPGRAILMSWPDYRSRWPTRIAGLLPKGGIIIYIGESIGGCTASEGFEDCLSRNFSKITESFIPQWFGINDYMRVFKKDGEINDE